MVTCESPLVTNPQILVHSIQCLHLLLCQLEIIYGDILCNVCRSSTPWYGHSPPGHSPIQHDLCLAFAPKTLTNLLLFLTRPESIIAYLTKTANRCIRNRHDTLRFQESY